MGETIIHNEWRADQHVLLTRVSGTLQPADLEAWRLGLFETAALIPASQDFRLLVDLRGYTVADQEREIHMELRNVVPQFLLDHGFRAGFLDLFEVPDTPSDTSDTARCIAAAHVHHECQKMAMYNEQLGRPQERFFCSRAEAEAWIVVAPEHA